MGKGPEGFGSSTEAEICTPDNLEASALTQTSCKQLVNNLIGSRYVMERRQENLMLYRVTFRLKSSKILADWIQQHSVRSRS